MPVVASTILTLVIIVLYRPALGFELMSDDFQWVQHAHRARHHLADLFTDLDSMYRPTATWTLALDHLLWDHNPAGYHLTNVILHTGAALLLVRLAARTGIGPIGAWAIGLVWATSPFAFEPAASVAPRHESMLFLSWLGLLLSWPRSGEPWSRRRLAGVCALTLAALFSKETWVVTPGIVCAVEWALRRSSLRRSVLVSLPFVLLTLVYVSAYSFAFPGDKSYFEWSLTPLAKIPHEAAAFFSLEELSPALFHFSVKAGLALLVLLSISIYGLRRRDPAALIGIALFCLPTLPTLLVPYLPPRYATMPYAGFLLILASTLTGALRALRPALRRLAHTLVAIMAVFVAVVGSITVRADLADWAEISRATTQLLSEARRTATELPLGRPVAVIRMENADPLRAVVAAPHGSPKLLFERGPDPYGLVDTSALFEWAREDERFFVRYYDPSGDQRGYSGDVLIHRLGGFEWRARDAKNLDQLVNGLLDAHRPVRVIYCERS